MVNDICNKFKFPHVYKSLMLLLEEYSKMHANMPKNISRTIGDTTFNIIEECVVLSYDGYEDEDFARKLDKIKSVSSKLKLAKIRIDMLKGIRGISKDQQGSLYRIIGNIETQLEKYSSYIESILGKTA